MSGRVKWKSPKISNKLSCSCPLDRGRWPVYTAPMSTTPNDSFYEDLFDGMDSIPTDPMLDEPWWREDDLGDDDEQMYPRDTELSGDMDPESW